MAFVWNPVRFAGFMCKTDIREKIIQSQEPAAAFFFFLLKEISYFHLSLLIRSLLRVKLYQDMVALV